MVEKQSLNCESRTHVACWMDQWSTRYDNPCRIKTSINATPGCYNDFVKQLEGSSVMWLKYLGLVSMEKILWTGWWCPGESEACQRLHVKEEEDTKVQFTTLVEWYGPSLGEDQDVVYFDKIKKAKQFSQSFKVWQPNKLLSASWRSSRAWHLWQ